MIVAEYQASERSERVALFLGWFLLRHVLAMVLYTWLGGQPV